MAAWRRMAKVVQIALLSTISRGCMYSFLPTLGLQEFMKKFNWVCLTYFYGSSGFLLFPLIIFPLSLFLVFRLVGLPLA